MTKGFYIFLIGTGIPLVFSGILLCQDLCNRVEMKPVLSLEQIRQNEFVDFLCEIMGLKDKPEWPSDISGMTPEQYYKMEVELLVKYGFPPIFMGIEPVRIVNRRYFSSLMFQIAMEVDKQVQTDCVDAHTETGQLQCLVDHKWLYTKEGRIYRQEILSILCNKRKDIKKLIPAPPIEILPIRAEEFLEATLETPASQSF